MPSYPDSIYLKAAEAVERELESGPHHDTDAGQDEALARAVLDAVAEDLGQYAAARIEAHMEASGPAMSVRLRPDAALKRTMRRGHFLTAARIAAFAFLSEDDLKAIAARELAAGNAVICTGPEVPEGER